MKLLFSQLSHYRWVSENGELWVKIAAIPKRFKRYSCWTLWGKAEHFNDILNASSQIHCGGVKRQEWYGQTYFCCSTRSLSSSACLLSSSSLLSLSSSSSLSRSSSCLCRSLSSSSNLCRSSSSFLKIMKREQKVFFFFILSNIEYTVNKMSNIFPRWLSDTVAEGAFYLFLSCSSLSILCEVT